MAIWEDNICTLFAYKSDRKNAKIISDITIRHLITQNKNEQISDEHILQYFSGIVGQLVYDIKNTKTINITTYTSIDTITSYRNANNAMYSHKHTIRLDNKRKKFYSIEQCINYLYDIILLLYPYTQLDINTVYSNEGIRHFIKLYYGH